MKLKVILAVLVIFSTIVPVLGSVAAGASGFALTNGKTSIAADGAVSDSTAT